MLNILKIIKYKIDPNLIYTSTQAVMSIDITTEDKATYFPVLILH